MKLYEYTLSIDEEQELKKEGVFVYIIKLSNNKYYTGITKNLVVRLLQHTNGLSKSTRQFRPIVLKWITKFSNYKDARWLEKKIKNRGARNYLCHNK